MNRKIVGIFVMTLLMTSGMIVALPMSDIGYNSNLSEVVMFIQEPDIPENEPPFAMSDIYEPWRAYDDFWGLTNPIYEVRWWNIAAQRVGDKLNPGDPEGAVFTITFYNDDGTGKPGDIVCTYENVMPIIGGTGIMYEFPSLPESEGIFELYYYEAVLDTSCSLSEGWISIVKTDSVYDFIGGIMSSEDGNDNMCFYNVNTQQWSSYQVDLAFSLIAYNGDISCDGILGWADVKPGSTVTGTISVKNIGNQGSLLDWQVESNMDWGEWTFSPESGEDLTPEDGPVTITVTVTAPDEKNKDFTGEIYLVNKNNEQDTCSITVSLTTSKTKTINTSLFLQKLFQRFPLFEKILNQIQI